jgi:uncharacterized membrane protein
MGYSVCIRGDDMQIIDKNSFSYRRKAWLDEGRGLLPLFSIWGVQWLLNALLDVAEEWYNLENAKLIILLITVIISMGVVGRGIILAKKQGRELPEAGGSALRLFESGPWSLLLPGIMLVGVVVLLNAIGSVGPFFSPLFRASMLAVVYVQFGVMFGKVLVYLGTWLFVLVILMGIWYLGYSQVVLEGMGGLSLLACGYILRFWSR